MRADSHLDNSRRLHRLGAHNVTSHKLTISANLLNKFKRLVQLCVLRLGRGENGDVGVGVFPEGEEGVVRSAGVVDVSAQGVSAGQPQAGQRGNGFVKCDARPIEDSLKFGGGFSALMRCEVSFAANIDGIEVSPEGATAGDASFVG